MSPRTFNAVIAAGVALLTAVATTAAVLLGVWRMQADSEARIRSHIDRIHRELAAEHRADVSAITQRLDALLHLLAVRGAGPQ